MHGFHYYIEFLLWGLIGSQKEIIDSPRMHFLDIV